TGFGARGFVGRGGYRWGGGFWRGRYWPGVFFGASFLWFLPVLPAYSPVYWWDNVPYYYYDNAYYTWDSGSDGYVATAPPPAATCDDSGAADASNAGPGPSATDANAAPPTSGNLYAYPKNGQSPQQQT